MKKGSLLREAAFILVFEKIFRSEDSCDEIYSDALDAGIFDLEDSPADEEGLRNVSCMLFKGVYDNLDEVDSVISRYSGTRQIGRISKICLAILRLALYELKYNNLVPTNVVISEAVGLAMNYGLDPDVKFVNGLLGKYADDTAEEKQSAEVSGN